jgi:methyl-accepting chemotaxis protein
MHLSLRSQLLLTSVGGIAVVCAMALAAASWSVSSDLNTRLQSELDRSMECVATQLTDQRENLTQLGQMVACRPDLVQAIEKNDRAAAREIAHAAKTAAGVELVTVSDTSGTVLARGHSDKAGDSVLAQTVVAKSLRGEASSGLEPGTTAGFLLRAACPVRHGDKIIGTVVVGVDPFADHRFVDAVKKNYHLECTVFCGDLRISTTLLHDGHRATGTKLNNETVTERVLGRGESYRGTAEILGADYGVMYSPLRDAEGTAKGMLFMGRSMADIQQAKHQLILAILLPVSGMTLLAGIACLILARRLTEPLRKLTVGLAELTHGKWDLTRRFEARGHNEVAAAARSVNSLLEKLQLILRDVARESGTLSASSSDLSTNATQLSQDAERIAGQSSTVAAAANQLTANMRSMAASTEQMSVNTRNVAAAVEETTASIAEIARNAEQAATAATNASKLAHISNEKISQLGTAAQTIGKVVDVIDDIADQTNLLALNATIEAARAGEVGKGFAVVAAEITELAKQTVSATKDIRSRIEGIQASTSETVQVIAEINRAIDKADDMSRAIAASVEEQSSAAKEIAANVTQSSVAVESVARGVAESATVSHEISRNIGQVDVAVKESAASAALTEQASGRLKEITTVLGTIVDQFHTGSAA